MKADAPVKITLGRYRSLIMPTSLPLLLVIALGLSACQSIDPQPSTPASPTAASNQTAPPKTRAIGTAKARQDCLYYSRTPAGKMALGGSLAMGTQVAVLRRNDDGWSDVRLRNGQEASIPSEDLATLSQYKQIQSRASAAQRGKFQDPRPKIAPGSGRGFESKLPTPPPPPDFVPPPLPDNPTDDPLSNVPSSILE